MLELQVTHSRLHSLVTLLAPLLRSSFRLNGLISLDHASMYDISLLSKFAQHKDVERYYKRVAASLSEERKWHGGSSNVSALLHYKIVFHLQVLYPMRMALLEEDRDKLMTRSAVFDEYHIKYKPQQPVLEERSMKWTREEVAFSALIDCYEALVNISDDVSSLSDDRVWRKFCEVLKVVRLICKLCDTLLQLNDVLAQLEREDIQVQLTLLSTIEMLSSGSADVNRSRLIETFSNTKILTDLREEMMEKCWIRTLNAFEEFKKHVDKEFSLTAIEREIEMHKSSVILFHDNSRLTVYNRS